MPELWIPSNQKLDTRLVKRYSLQTTPNVQNPYWLQRTITPITSLDELLREPNIQDSGALDPGGGAGWATYLTVPDDERWTIFQLDYTGSAGTITTGGLQLHDGSTGVALITWTADQTNVRALSHPFIVEHGWLIQLYIAAYNAGDTVTLKMFTLVEKSWQLA